MGDSDAVSAGLSASQLRQVADTLTDASDLLTRKALELQSEDEPVSEPLLREANAIDLRGIHLNLAADESDERSSAAS